jgi:hypothetical protein
VKPWFLLAVAAVVIGCTQPAASPSDGVANPSAKPPVRITIAGAGSIGIFDPAPVADPDGKRIWMSYSSVGPSKWPANKLISTRIAYSDDGGVHWTDHGAVNLATDVTLPLAAPNNAGTWQQEVSRLAYDPYAPAGERWILVWMRYIEVNGVRHFDHTWIAMRTAPSPTGKWSAERKLFVGAGYPSSDDSIVGPPQYRLGSLHSDLAGCAAATEPGLLARPEALYMSLYCAWGNVADGRQILLRRPRDTGSWEYAGTFSTNSDARAMGYDDFSATELIEQDGKQYLVVSPEKDARYKGCLVFEIADLGSARLARAGGALQIVRKIELGLGGVGFGGACGYSPGLRVGFLYSELYSTAPQFRIFATNVGL